MNQFEAGRPMFRLSDAHREAIKRIAWDRIHVEADAHLIVLADGGELESPVS